MNKRYPLELKAEVTELVCNKSLTVSQASNKYSIPANTIYVWLHKHRKNANQSGNAQNEISSDSSSVVTKTTKPDQSELKPKLPGHLSLQETIALWGFGRTVGFDDPSFGLKCRQNGVKAEEVIEFGKWLELADKHNAVTNCLISQFDLTESKQACARAQGEIALRDQRLKERDATIAEITTELFIRKKILTILS